MAQKAILPIAVGLDIGTTNVRCVVGMQEEHAGAPSIIGVGAAATSGVRKGTIADIEETVSGITAAVDEAERISGISVTQASVGVNGYHILSVASHGVIAMGSSSREITEQDITRVEEAATVIQLPPNREIIQAFPRNYTIDGQDHIKDPHGMSGVRLEVDTCLITAATPFIKNLTRSVNQAGLGIVNYLGGPIAAANTLITKRDKELGALILDIGASTTGMAVFEEGELLQVAVIPVGAGHITSDLAIGLRTDIDTAEKIKLEHIDADPRLNNRKDGEIAIEEINGQEMVASKAEINRIVQARLEELFDLTNRELKKIKRDGMLPGGVILCGGGAKMRNIDEYAKQAMRLPARLGKPEGFSGIVDKITDPSFTVAIGLMLDNLNTEAKPPLVGSMLKGAKAVAKGLIQRFRR